MAFVRQTQDGVNGNSSTGLPSEYECTSGVAPYVYRTGITIQDNDNDILFADIPSFRLSGERIFFHKFMAMAVMSTQVLAYPTTGLPATTSTRLVLLRNMSDVSPSSPTTTASNLFGNANAPLQDVLTVPVIWKPQLVTSDSVKSLIEPISSLLTIPNFALHSLIPGEYKIIVTSGSAADLGGGELSIVLAHSE